MSPSEKSVEKASTATPKQSRQRNPHDETRNPGWFKPVMFGFMIVGFLWVIVYYVSAQQLPILALGPWNIVIGFAVMFVGFIMTTKWK